jgi:DNA topoisomerase IA
LKPGFIEVMPWQRHSDSEIPVYKIGDIINIAQLRITENKT